MNIWRMGWKRLSMNTSVPSGIKDEAVVTSAE
jgi:hypothetical protein